MCGNTKAVIKMEQGSRRASWKIIRYENRLYSDRKELYLLFPKTAILPNRG